jgi:hypothetical protein
LHFVPLSCHFYSPAQAILNTTGLQNTEAFFAAPNRRYSAMGQMIKNTCSDTNIITLPESDDSTLCVTYTNIVDVERIRNLRM